MDECMTEEQQEMINKKLDEEQELEVQPQDSDSITFHQSREVHSHGLLLYKW